MSWAAALTALETNLTAAAAVVNALDPGKDPFVVHAGEALSALQRSLRYWYDGDQESSTGGRTLTRNNVQEKVTVRWYWPVMNRDDKWISQLEVQLEAANRATQAALYGDSLLGDNAIGLEVLETSTGWQQVREAWVRVLTIPVLIDMAWTEVIAQ